MLSENKIQNKELIELLNTHLTFRQLYKKNIIDNGGLTEDNLLSLVIDQSKIYEQLSMEFQKYIMNNPNYSSYYVLTNHDE